MIKRLDFNEGFKQLARHVAISIVLLETEIKACRNKRTQIKERIGKLQTPLCVINKGYLILT